MSWASLRKRPRVCYSEYEEPDLDEYIFCTQCADYVYEYCSLHGPLLVVPDNKVLASPPARIPYAALTIPDVFLHLNYSTIPDAGVGVFATLTLPSDVRFGPYAGLRTELATNDYCWQLYDSARRPTQVVDGQDLRRANWMRYVNCARHCSEQNLIAYQYQGQIYYRTMRIIPRGCELLVYYGGEFAARLGIDTRIYNSKQYYIRATPDVTKRVCNNELETSDAATSHEKLHSAGNKDNPPKDNITSKTEGKTSSTSKGNTPSVNKGKTNSIAKGKTPTAKGKTPTAKDKTPTAMDKTATAKHKTATAKDKTPTAKGKTPTAKYKTPTAKPSTATSKTNLTQVAKGKPRSVAKFNPPRIVDSDPQVLTQNIPSPPKKQKSAQKPVKSQNNAHVECDHCNNKFTDKSVLARHISANHSKDKSKNAATNKFVVSDLFNLKCSECNYVATTIQILERHSRLHEQGRRFVCVICQYRFNAKQLLQRHLIIHKEANFNETSINAQSVEKEQHCQLCQYTTATSSDLKRHFMMHSCEKSYKCNMCDYKTAVSSDLKTHCRKHTGEQPFKCDMCDYKTAYSSDLKTHCRKHTGEQPFKCDMCDYKTAYSSDLKTHCRKHTGEQPFKCDMCDYKTAFSSALKWHYSKHTGEQPFECDMCDYKTAFSSALKRHLRTHTGEKPYECDFCERKFAENRSLNVHLRKHMGTRSC